MCDREWRTKQNYISNSAPMIDPITLTQRNKSYKSYIDIPVKQRTNVSEKLVEHFVVTDISFHLLVFVKTNFTHKGMKKI